MKLYFVNSNIKQKLYNDMTKAGFQAHQVGITVITPAQLVVYDEKILKNDKFTKILEKYKIK